MDALSVHERAQILVATRQFDRALTAWEALFEDPNVPPAQMDLGGYLLDYLTVSVRVQLDARRPREALRKLSERADTPRYLRRHLLDWISALEALEGDLAKPPTVARARSLMRRADGLSEFPADRERLIYDLVASALLLRYVDQAKLNDGDLAEAFYWLGVAESRSIDAYWVPQTEFHLEAAIPARPRRADGRGRLRTPRGVRDDGLRRCLRRGRAAARRLVAPAGAAQPDRPAVGDDPARRELIDCGGVAARPVSSSFGTRSRLSTVST